MKSKCRPKAYRYRYLAHKVFRARKQGSESTKRIGESFGFFLDRRRNTFGREVVGDSAVGNFPSLGGAAAASTRRAPINASGGRVGLWRAHSLSRSLARWSVVVSTAKQRFLLFLLPVAGGSSAHSSVQDNMALPKVYFDITIGGKQAGRVTMEARSTFLHFCRSCVAFVGLGADD